MATFHCSLRSSAELTSRMLPRPTDRCPAVAAVVPIAAADDHRQTTHLVALSAAALPIQRTLSAVRYGQDS